MSVSSSSSLTKASSSSSLKKPRLDEPQKRFSLTSCLVLPESVERAVFHLLALRDLVVLLQVSVPWKAQITCFLKSRYYNGRLVDSPLYQDDSAGTRNYLAFMDAVNIRQCSLRLVTWSPSFKATFEKKRATIEKLGLSNFGTLIHMSHLPKLRSLRVGSIWADSHHALPVPDFLKAHRSTLTELYLAHPHESIDPDTLCSLVTGMDIRHCFFLRDGRHVVYACV